MEISLYLVYPFRNQVTGSLVLFSKGIQLETFCLSKTSSRSRSPWSGVFYVLSIAIKLLHNYSFMKLTWKSQKCQHVRVDVIPIGSGKEYQSFPVLISLCCWQPRRKETKTKRTLRKSHALCDLSFFRNFGHCNVISVEFQRHECPRSMDPFTGSEKSQKRRSFIILKKSFWQLPTKWKNPLFFSDT